jgi:hypothetical protein
MFHSTTACSPLLVDEGELNIENIRSSFLSVLALGVPDNFGLSYGVIFALPHSGHRISVARRLICTRLRHPSHWHGKKQIFACVLARARERFRLEIGERLLCFLPLKRNVNIAVRFYL